MWVKVTLLAMGRMSKSKQNLGAEGIPVQATVYVGLPAAAMAQYTKKHNHKNEQQHQDDSHHDQRDRSDFEGG